MNIKIIPDQTGFRYSVNEVEGSLFSFDYFAICTGGKQIFGTVEGASAAEWVSVPISEPIMHIGITCLRVSTAGTLQSAVQPTANSPDKKAESYSGTSYPQYFLELIERIGPEKIFLSDNYILISEDDINESPEDWLHGLSWHKIKNDTALRYEWQFHAIPDTFGIIIYCNYSLPEISVIIPFHHNICDLQRAVNSVLQQTFQSFEIILVNDFSSDKDIFLIQELLHSPKVKLIDNLSNLGQSISLNIGLLHAKGKYVVQLDADDWLTADALEFIENLTKEQNYAAISGNPYVVTNNNTQIWDGHAVEQSTDYFTYKGINAPRIYKTTILKEMGGWSVNDSYNGRYYEDRLMLSRIAEKHKIGYFDKSIYYVSVHSESLSRKRPLETASAKLSILVNEVNKRNLQLRHTLKGHNMLSAEIMSKTFGINAYTWSIIIPFSRNAAHLHLSLKSWNEAIGDGHTNVRLIVVNDNIKIDLSFIEKQFHFVTVIKTEGNKGPAHARNLGVEFSNSDYIYFSDEDHIVPPDILYRHEELHVENNHKTIVIGNVWGRRVVYNLDPEIETITKHKLLKNFWFRKEFESITNALATGEDYKLFETENNIYRTCFDYSFSDQWQREWGEVFSKHGFGLEEWEHSWLKCGTGSASILRENFNSIGGFNETLQSMEDWEFGIRAGLMNYKIVMAPFSEPFHIIHPKKAEERKDHNKTAIASIKSKFPGIIERAVNSGMLENIVGMIFSEETHQVHHRVSPEKKNKVCLTFDDGPHEYSTNLLLDRLQHLNLKGTFFVQGDRSLFSKPVLDRIINEGHELGIHNWHHRSHENSCSEEMIRDINKTRALLKQLTGKSIGLFRPPYGRISNSLTQKLNDEGYKIIGWHNNSMDWARGVTDIQIISNLAAEGIMNKILLFHDGTGEPESQFKALQWLEQLCTKNELESITVSEYLKYNSIDQVLSGLKYIDRI
ncbi:hypothetical protein TH53_06840 [Pedobacter lusitanus]|uniref:NodB homology domain-containing protein n=1 Tax=Pedobacter lusitanus TaxID=1503925 RepID=A0A0D0F898_9SPHI|nr:glycosyltransferase [Pedobacter lusitanus]KIO77848.1 hypothetical protein TH53_06840 [Pedobacter lusitanus]